MKKFRKMEKSGIRLIKKNIFLLYKKAEARAEPKNIYPQYGKIGKREFLKEKYGAINGGRFSPNLFM